MDHALNFPTRVAFSTLILILAALSTACGDSGTTSDRTSAMTSPAKTFSPRIEKLFAQTKPVCFGRFVIDVPETAQVAWGPSQVNDDISSYPGEGHRLRGEIHDKVSEIEAIKHRKEPSALLGVFDGPNVDSKIVVGYQSRHDTGLVQLHSYIRLGKHAFVQSAPSAVLGRDDADVINKTGYQRYVTEMQDIAARLRVREEAEVPSEPGICIDSGFVAEAEGRYYELISVGFRFPEYPDVSFSVMTIKSDRANPDDSLEVALKSAKESAEAGGEGRWYASIRKLRTGKREMGGWAGAEQLARLPPQPGEKNKPWTHEFAFKSIGVANDIFHPYVNMEMSTGVVDDSRREVPPTLKDEEAVALWDKLTGSIRPRPVSATPVSPEPPSAPDRPRAALPLDTVVPSLQRCPQSGTWECAATLATGEKRQRYFPQGMVLPTVIVRGPERSLWQKIQGVPPNRLVETYWTLVSYDLPKPDESCNL